jgi:hypothetical protein
LLDELNHRLKNNLQILYGVLQTACRKTDNAEAREVLSDTSRRIGAMGTAQQVFYSVRSSTDVSGQRFLEAVCANARVLFSKEVSINLEVTTGSPPKETAVPLALVLNELLRMQQSTAPTIAAESLSTWVSTSVRDRTNYMCKTAGPDSTLRRPKAGHQGSDW